MTPMLDTLSRIISEVREQTIELSGGETFDELGIDSLGVLMVIISVGTEYSLEDPGDEEIVNLIKKIKGIPDIVSYVSTHNS